MKKDAAESLRPTLEQILPRNDQQEVFFEALAAIEAARFLRKLRERVGLTQRQVAGKLGISQARISAIESGEGRDGPSYALIRRYVAACGHDFSLAQGLQPANAPAEQPLLRALALEAKR